MDIYGEEQDEGKVDKLLVVIDTTNYIRHQR